MFFREQLTNIEWMQSTECMCFSFHCWLVRALCLRDICGGSHQGFLQKGPVKIYRPGRHSHISEGRARCCTATHREKREGGAVEGFGDRVRWGQGLCDKGTGTRCQLCLQGSDVLCVRACVCLVVTQTPWGVAEGWQLPLNNMWCEEVRSKPGEYCIYVVSDFVFTKHVCITSSATVFLLETFFKLSPLTESVTHTGVHIRGESSQWRQC